MVDTSLQPPLPAFSGLRLRSVADRRTRFRLTTGARLALYGAVVAAIAYCAILSTRGGGSIAVLWPAGAIALAAVWRTPRHARTAAFLAMVGAFAVTNLLVNAPPRAALFVAANGLELLAALFLMSRFRRADLNVHELSGLTRFVLGVAAVAPVAGGLVVAAGAGSLVDGSPFALFERWYLGHVLGLSVVGTFLLSGSAEVRRCLRRRTRQLEAAAMAVGVALVAGLAFLSPLPMGFLVYPALLLAAVRFRVAGAATAVLIVVAFATAGYLGEAMDAAPTDAGATMRRLQLYLLFGCVCTPFIAAVLNERDLATRQAAEGRARAEAASAAKSKLLANVSHEVRTPLNAVVNLSELMLQERVGPINEAQRELLSTMVSSAALLVSLADDLTDTAKAEAGKLAVAPVVLDARSVVRQVVDQLACEVARNRADIRVELPEAPLTALADPLRLSQILTNLLTNAIKYAGAGGPIVVSGAVTEDGFVRVEVLDHGPGIRPDQYEDLFEPFNRLGKEAGRIDGTGIGLAIARKLADLQGGRLEFDSEPGRGSRFWVLLPGG